jgi:hypothetical protein
MTPSHAVRDGRRYRYYVSRALIRANTTGSRVPAAQIEHLVIERLRLFLSRSSSVLDHATPSVPGLAALKRLSGRAATLAATWPEMSLSRQRSILCTLIVRVEFYDERVDIQLAPARLATLLSREPETPVADSPAEAECLTLSISARLRRVGSGGKLIVGEQSPFVRAKPDPAMLKLLVRAQDLKQKLLQGRWHSMTALARAEGLSDSYATRLLRLTYLAPSFVGTILDGSHPPELTAIKLMRGEPLPMDWQEQRVLLGYA